MTAIALFKAWIAFRAYKAVSKDQGQKAISPAACMR